MFLLNRLISNDLPRSRVLAVLLIGLLLALAFTPFLFPGVKALNVAAKVLVFVVLVASFDLLLGYTGIVSFAHTMFFGIGAYGVAIASTRMGPGWASLALGVGAALAVSLLLSLLISTVATLVVTALVMRLLAKPRRDRFPRPGSRWRPLRCSARSMRSTPRRTPPRRC